MTDHGRSRAVIEGVEPKIDGGQFPIKRVEGEVVEVQADIYTDGHDVVECVLLYRHAGEKNWTEVWFEPLVNDRWKASFIASLIGRMEYTVLAWVDRFRSWIRDLKKRSELDADIEVNLRVGAELVADASKRAAGADAEWLRSVSEMICGITPIKDRLAAAQDPRLMDLMRKYADRQFATKYDRDLGVVVDPVHARFSTWYELFPRSFASEPNQHGTFSDVIRQLPRIAKLGFDVLYLPPIHPIGQAYRKGKNNSPKAEPDDVGSPWGIGAREGGHTALHPQLGTLDDFHRLVRTARDHGIRIAMDVAYQCSPDHPWVKEHPDWFRRRPDGSIQYAENPPKKYQDIYPIDFESSDWKELWSALAGVVQYWIAQGVTIFRVDNPHTKAFPFWEWMISTIKKKDPDTIFLSEAFTRPKVMYRLAKVGFSQSYTYFSWRNNKQELTEYFTELSRAPVRDFFRPNLWPNTPDILPEFLQWSGAPGFRLRLLLAATLGASYGIYGPAFELCVHQPVAPGKEEYLNSEKYQLINWTLGGANDISEFIGHVNKIRKENPALQTDRGLQFHPVDNPEIICYSKMDALRQNRVVVVANLDPNHVQSGWVDLQLQTLGVEQDRPYQMQDRLGGGHFLWHGGRNFIQLDPQVAPAHVFVMRQHVRSEQDFDYFL